jgi:hypothetical protein
MAVSLDELRKLKYIAVDTIGDRTVNLMPLWDGEQWHSWFPGDDRLFKLAMHDVVVGEYLGKAAATSSDWYVPFLAFAWQRASWPEVFHLWRHLPDDLHHFATCTAKLEHFHEHRAAIGHGVSAFVQTELEYLFVLARSVFDLQQELISRVWSKRVRLLDPVAEVRRKGRPLPLSFPKIVLRDKQDVRSAEDIATVFGLSPRLAGAYAGAGKFFCGLREVRDAIVHSGTSVDMIFVTDQGFGVHRDLPALRTFGLSLRPQEGSTNVVPLMPLVAHVVFGTLGACDAIIDALAQDVQFPPELAPDYSVFLRGFHNEALLRLKAVYEDAFRSSTRVGPLDESMVASSPRVSRP